MKQVNCVKTDTFLFIAHNSQIDAKPCNQHSFENHKLRKLCITILETLVNCLRNTSRHESVSDVQVFVSCHRGLPHHW